MKYCKISKPPPQRRHRAAPRPSLRSGTCHTRGSHRGRLQPFERELAVLEVDLDEAPFGEGSLEDLGGQRVLDLLLDHPLERTGAVGRVVTLAGNLGLRFRRDLKLQALLLELLFQAGDLE